MRIQRPIVGALAALALCGLNGLVAAQSGAPSSSSSAESQTGGLEEIVVTARRRSENIEKVPATITALGADDLIKQGIHTEADLQSAVAGLTVRAANTNNQLNYVIRGESVDAYTGSPPGVQPYINEVPIAANSATAFYDLENIQVLKGPQGTLFGRNSTGGAVLYQAAPPKNDFGGYASIQYGNYQQAISEAALNLPIVEDKVLLRVAGNYTSGGAYIHNLYDGSMLGDRTVQSGRIGLLLHPTEALTNVTTVQFSHFGGTNAPELTIYVVPCGQQGGGNSCTFAPSVPAFVNLINGTSGVLRGYPAGFVFPGGYPGLVAFLNSQPHYTVDQNGSHHHDAEGDFGVNTTTFEFSPTLSVKNIFGYSYSSANDNYDNDGTPYPTLQQAAGTSESSMTKQLSDELQLLGSVLDDRLNFLIGGFYVRQVIDNDSSIFGVFIAPPTTVGSFDVRYHAQNVDKTRAVFSQVTYRLTDKFNVTLGGRETWDDLSLSQSDGSVFGAGVFQHVEQNKPSTTVSLDYQFTPSLMVYATSRGSWRVGGYNPFVPPIGNTTTAAQGGNFFQPETVRDAELGAKHSGTMGGVPFQLNADVYYSWVRNFQKNAFVVVNGNITSATVNVPAAQIKGFEANFQLRPAPWLKMGGALSYSDGRFTENQAILYGEAATFGPFGDTPRWTGSLFGVLSEALPASKGTLSYRTDLYAQSSFYFSNLNATLNPGTLLPSYALVNMRLDWENMFSSKLTTSLFVKNLANKLYFTGGSPNAQLTSSEQADFGMPRIFGAAFKVVF